MRYEIRSYRPDDLEPLARIYRESIRQRGAEHYSAEQIHAWSSFAGDTEAFRAWLEEALTLVAVNPVHEQLAFGGIQPQGRISSLFVAPGFMRIGIASRLLDHLLEEARTRGLGTVTTEASEFSKPLFEKHGFEVTEVEHTRREGVDLSRYAMRARV